MTITIQASLKGTWQSEFSLEWENGMKESKGLDFIRGQIVTLIQHIVEDFFSKNPSETLGETRQLLTKCNYTIRTSRKNEFEQISILGQRHLLEGLDLVVQGYHQPNDEKSLHKDFLAMKFQEISDQLDDVEKPPLKINEFNEVQDMFINLSHLVLNGVVELPEEMILQQKSGKNFRAMQWLTALSMVKQEIDFQRD